MTRKKRIEYLVCTLSVAATGFVIYGLIGSQQPLANESKLQSFLFSGCMAGLGFASLFSTIILSAAFFKKRGLAFKVVASILWPVTLAVCVYAGVLSYIPYQIYNIIKIISSPRKKRRKKRSKDISKAN